jgi:cold shock CspA family protein
MLSGTPAPNTRRRWALPFITGKVSLMKLNALAKAITLATVLSTTSFAALAADIPLSATVEADKVTTKVISVDAANHQVVLEGAEGKPVHVQLSDKAKNLASLKAGDKVDIEVQRSVAAYLDTDVDKGLPGSVERTGELRKAPGSDNPGGEAFRQVQVQLKITKIDLKKNQVTLENPSGQSKTLDVKRPEIQAKLKDLKEGQSVIVTYTDILKVTSEHES